MQIRAELGFRFLVGQDRRLVRLECVSIKIWKGRAQKNAELLWLRVLLYTKEGKVGGRYHSVFGEFYL